MQQEPSQALEKPVFEEAEDIFAWCLVIFII